MKEWLVVRSRRTYVTQVPVNHILGVKVCQALGDTHNLEEILG